MCVYINGNCLLCIALRFASAKRTDERVKVMNEIIAGIKVIKMYGWEYAFKKVISRIRRWDFTL